MRDGLKTRINTVCAIQSEAQQQQSELRIKQGIDRTALLAEFSRLTKYVVRPVMDEFSCYFSDRFYTCKIINDDIERDITGRSLFRSGITFRIYKDCALHDELKYVPHYSVLWDEANQVVRFYRSNTIKMAAGEAGSDGKAFLHEVTVDLIERKLLLFTSWLFESQRSR